MSEERIKDMIEPIPNWEFTYRYDGSRTCGKSYTQSLLDEKDKEMDRLINLNKQLVEECQRLEDEEIRLNNIINELEKWLIEHIDEYRDMEQDAMFEFGLVLDKLKELKENNKNV